MGRTPDSDTSDDESTIGSQMDQLEAIAETLEQAMQILKHQRDDFRQRRDELRNR